MNTLQQEITRLQRILEGLKGNTEDYEYLLVRDEIITFQEALDEQDRSNQSKIKD
jgi:hypothetical protein